MKLSKLPIGIFDSGIGGLTVYKAVKEMLPEERLIYFGDTARVPYGNKTREAVRAFACEISQYLLSRKVKMLVIACNTATSLALDSIRGLTPLPVLGVIEPGVRAALDITPRGGKVLVIGTKATVSSGAYSMALKIKDPSVTVREQACPLFVPIVEEGWSRKPFAVGVAEEYLGCFRKDRFDSIILGCTHYPLLKETVAWVMGPEVKIINSALAAAQAVKRELEEQNLLSDSAEGGDEFIVSDGPEKFSEVAMKLLGIKTGEVIVKRF